MEWTASKVDSLQINKGQEFQNNDGLSHSDMNAVVNNALYAVKKVDENSAKIEKLEKNTEGIITSNGITRTTNAVIIEDNDLKVNGNIIINDGEINHNVLDELNEKANATNVEEKLSLKADLVNGKIPVSQLPDTGITVDTAKKLITSDSKLISADDVYNGLTTSLYNIGAFDTLTENDNVVTITRKTGYFNLSKFVLDNQANGAIRGTIPGCYEYGPIGLDKDFLPDARDIGMHKAVIKTNSNFISGDDNQLYGNANNYQVNIIYISLPNSYTSKESYIQYFSENLIFLQYELATEYTEKVIKNQSLIDIPADGTRWLREEWEKGLNLWDKGNITFEGEYAILCEKRKVGKYSLRISSTRNTSYEEFHWYIRDLSTATTLLDGILPNNSYTFNITSEMLTHDIRLYSWGTASNDVCKVMLNYGDNPYPYQPYNGDIVHKKELDEVKDRLDILDRLDNTDNINIEASYSYGKDGSNYNRAEYIKITNNSLQNITITSIDDTRIIGTQQATISSGNSVSYSQSDTSSSSGGSDYTITINYQIGNVNLSKKYTIVPVKVTSQ